jgi:hypothetical protein
MRGWRIRRYRRQQRHPLLHPRHTPVGAQKHPPTEQMR